MNKISQSDKIRIKRKIKLFPAVSKGDFLVFIFWPFASLFQALINFRLPQAKTLFYMFCIYFGFVFVYEDPALRRFGADSASYAAKLIELNHQSISFEALMSSFYNEKEGFVDIYQPLVTWFVSIFTEDPRILFMVFATVFGFFYAQNLWIIFNSITAKVGLLLFLFMTAFALVNPIWNINGVRMWTAAQIFLYGNLRYFLQNDRKGLIWSASSILVHFSFIFPVAILTAYFFLPKKDYLLFAFYIITSFFIEIRLTQAREFLYILPYIFQPRVESYTNEVYAYNIGEAVIRSTWHVVWAGKFSTWITYAWIVAVYIRRNYWTKLFPAFHQIFMFALLMGGFANIAAQVPSGGRFVTVANGLFYALLVALLGQRNLNLRIKWLKQFTIPILAFVVIFKIRLGLDYTGTLTFVGNLLIAPFIKDQTPLIEFIKGIF